MVENICYGNKLFARIIKTSKFDGVFKFFTEDEDNLQVSAWNHKKGYECVPHIHNVIPRTIDLVNEVVIVISGEVLVTFYTPEGKKIAERVLRKLDICHTLQGGHGYKILTEGTKIIEVKNGPFMGDLNYDKERTLIDPNNFYLHEQV